jgi:hypothetical protein
MAATIGLVLALVSAIAVNWAYSREHDAASKLPPLSPRNPVRNLRTVARSRPWLVGFGTESGGWLLYVAAVGLAPLALVQATSAAGIAVLALVTSRMRPRCLARHERAAVLIALAGLGLLSLSLVASERGGKPPNPFEVFLWLAAAAAAAAALIVTHTLLPRASSLGLAAGLLFAAGDISTKVVVQGGLWLVAIVALIACYAVGTSVLQSAFQHGNALTAAGIATLTTNAVPIAAGLVLFREPLPKGIDGTLRVLSFALIVVSAVVLADPRVRRDHGRRRVIRTVRPAAGVGSRRSSTA